MTQPPNAFLENFDKIEIERYGYIRLPEVHLQDEWRKKIGSSKKDSNQKFFELLVMDAFERKRPTFIKGREKEYETRIKHELGILEELGFTDYCLLVWIVIEKAREFGAFIDYGRGSMVSSLCFYVLDITGADPIEHDLIFERFVNRARSKKETIGGVMYLKGDLVADADLNLGPTRDKVKEWMEQVYPGRLSSILTLGTFTGKALVGDVYKAYDEVENDEAKRISALVEKHQGIVEDIEKMPEKNDDFKLWKENHPKTFEICLALRDLIVQEGKHASGYLLSYEPLYGRVPLQLNSEGQITCGYTKEDAAEFAVKLDLLGLSTNAVLSHIEKNIPVTLESIKPLLNDSPIIYDQYQGGKLLPYGLYQISADTAYRVLTKFKPKNLGELSDVSATARPGALAYVDDYAESKAVCPHPAFESILKTTRNVCLYQEEFLQMAMKLGFTGEEAEQIRRIVGKKKVDEIKAWKERIYKKAKENGFDSNVGDVLWKILEDSSRYSFNKSHSIATSMTSALTTYLKYKYPLVFYWACLCECKSQSGKTAHEEVAKVQREMHNFGIKLLPPDLALSDMEFKMDGNNIRYGLAFIKGISEKTVEKLQKFRTKDRPNKLVMFNALKESGLSVGVGASLIQAGCLQSVGESRARLVLELQTYQSSNFLTPREKELVNQFAPRNNFDILKTLAEIRDAKDEKGNPLIKPSRWETFKKKYEGYKAIWEQNRKNEKFANYIFEKQLLGFSYSGSLISVFGEFIDNLIPLDEIAGETEGIKVKGVGSVVEARSGKSLKGNKYIKVKLSDERGLINLMLFSDRADKLKNECGGEVPKEGSIILFTGTVKDGGTVFADTAALQNNRVCMKLGDLDDETKEKIKKVKKKS